MSTMKVQYSYAFSNISAHDQVVFNSIVGLLFGRTHAQWSQLVDGNPDLLVLGADAALGAAFVGSSRAVLRVSQHALLDEAMSIHWPLRAHEVQAALDQAAQILGAGNTAPAPSCYQLLDWPSHALLSQNFAHLRLATLLSTRAMTLAELSQSSGASIALCEQFIEKLLAANALCAAVPNSLSPPQAEPPALGFFARLRAHMGLPRTRVAS